MTITKENRTFSLEVEYTYTEDKHTPSQTSWYYVWAETETLTKAVVIAKRHFTEMVNSSGWNSKVKIVSVHEMQNDKSKPISKVVSPTELAPSRSKGTVTPTDTDGVAKTSTRKPRASKGTARKPTHNPTRRSTTKRNNNKST